MTIKEILQSGLINKAELARLIWPNMDKKAAPIRLAQKLSETAGQRLLPEDEAKIRDVLRLLTAKIEN